MIQLYREKRVRKTLLYDLFRTCRNHPWLPSKTHMTRKRKMTRPSDSNMIFEVDILFGLAFVDVSKRKALA